MFATSDFNFRLTPTKSDYDFGDIFHHVHIGFFDIFSCTQDSLFLSLVELLDSFFTLLIEKNFFKYLFANKKNG